MDANKIARINELAKKAKTVGLTPAETEERDILRGEYIASFRQSLAGQLDRVYFVEKDGSRTKLKKKDGK